MNQPYRCESEEVFQERLAVLQEYIRESNIDGVLDYYCPTSPVLYHVPSGIVHVVDANLSHEPEHLRQVIQQIIQEIMQENGGNYPQINYIYA
jgi:hypothetical protein